MRAKTNRTETQGRMRARRGGVRDARVAHPPMRRRAQALRHPPPPPPSRTRCTCLVPPPVLTGHASSLLRRCDTIVGTSRSTFFLLAALLPLSGRPRETCPPFPPSPLSPDRPLLPQPHLAAAPAPRRIDVQGPRCVRVACGVPPAPPNCRAVDASADVEAYRPGAAMRGAPLASEGG